MCARRIVIAVSSLAVVAAGLALTPAASADSVWYQSYQRASQSEVCAAQTGETPWQASWGADSSWHPSWEQWANKGTGGWTCGRSITWANDSSCAAGGPCVRGDIGPGGGLVFLISGGKTYEMAPAAWSGAGTPDAVAAWCSDTSSNITGAVGTAVGTGSANTTAMQTPACTSGAGVSARAYRGGGLTDWFLPSFDELNAMCNYSQNPTTLRTGVCTGRQDDTFSAGAYGFASDGYSSSSQAIPVTIALGQIFDDGSQGVAYKYQMVRVRPVRAF